MPPKVKRVRTGYVMVELSPGERGKLEKLCAKMSQKTGIRFNLAATFRYLLHEAK